jgi:hypothetical protein
LESGETVGGEDGDDQGVARSGMIFVMVIGQMRGLRPHQHLFIVIDGCVGIHCDWCSSFALSKL